MRSEGAGARRAAAPVDAGRRRSLALAAWSAAVAVTGSTRALHRMDHGHTPLDATRVASRVTARSRAATAPPGTVAETTAGTEVRPAGPAPAEPADQLTGDALVLHVARRASFGPTPALLAEIRSLGVDAWLEQQLAPTGIADDDVDEQLTRLRDLQRGPADFRALGRIADDVLADLRVAAVLRAARSNRHLQEVMVDLWHDHLAVSAAKAPVEWHLPAHDRDAIRPHALGRYVDLLQAVTRSGAMLEYLDTAASSAPEVNENHGRELLELHTTGPAAGYTQADVTGAARVLSGWTLDRNSLTPMFDPSRHDARPATVLGWSTPGRTGPDGSGDIDSLTAYLATHPATATRVAALLVRRFVADDPPDDLVASTAAAYLAADTDIATTLRHVLGSTAFRTAGGSLLRRPFDLFVAQLRGTDAALEVPNLLERLVPLPGPLAQVVSPIVDAAGAPLDPLVEATGPAEPLVDPLIRSAVGQRPIAQSILRVLRGNGQLLFAAPNPSGHPVAGVRWGSGDALLRRWTLGAALAHDGLAGVTIDPEALAGGAATAGALVDTLAQRCFVGATSPATRNAALAALGLTDDAPIVGPETVRIALAFLLAAPEMQVR